MLVSYSYSSYYALPLSRKNGKQRSEERISRSQRTFWRRNDQRKPMQGMVCPFQIQLGRYQTKNKTQKKKCLIIMHHIIRFTVLFSRGRFSPRFVSGTRGRAPRRRWCCRWCTVTQSRKERREAAYETHFAERRPRQPPRRLTLGNALSLEVRGQRRRRHGRSTPNRTINRRLPRRTTAQAISTRLIRLGGSLATIKILARPTISNISARHSRSTAVLFLVGHRSKRGIVVH